MTTEKWEERQEIRGEERGAEPSTDLQRLFLICLTSPLLHPSDNSLQKPGRELSAFYEQCVFHTHKKKQKWKSKHADVVTDTTNLESTIPRCRTIRHQRIPLRFQSRGYYSLIPSQSRTRLLKGLSSKLRRKASIKPKVQMNLKYIPLWPFLGVDMQFHGVFEVSFPFTFLNVVSTHIWSV